jgi:poly(3-hydroxybutyrate) depolymerase
VADISFITVQGGGHVWPDGDQYLDINRVGRRTSDFNANELIWEFLRNHPMP